MSGLEQWNWFLDGWIIVAGILCAISTALLGNFLVLRKMSMLGDAITHAILPGLAAAFMISDSRSSLPMFVGAVIAGILTALFTEWIRSFGKVDEGASMGVVFTSLFALGLVMIVQAADHVDLDPGCVLYGAIELTPLDTILITGWEIPRVVVVLSVVLLINLVFVMALMADPIIPLRAPKMMATTVILTIFSVQKRAAAGGMTNSEIIKISPTACKPMIVTTTTRPISVMSSKTTGKPREMANPSSKQSSVSSLYSRMEISMQVRPALPMSQASLATIDAVLP